mmetsp:Transcript_65889/g.134092  ORF Transcript_65889/g.134092 Transcript_65889/m.134092 type:complete len:292 (+) Transcript_65889:132-1007(+)
MASPATGPKRRGTKSKDGGRGRPQRLPTIGVVRRRNQACCLARARTIAETECRRTTPGVPRSAFGGRREDGGPETRRTPKKTRAGGTTPPQRRGVFERSSGSQQPGSELGSCFDDGGRILVSAHRATAGAIGGQGLSCPTEFCTGDGTGRCPRSRSFQPFPRPGLRKQQQSCRSGRTKERRRHHSRYCSACHRGRSTGRSTGRSIGYATGRSVGRSIGYSTRNGRPARTYRDHGSLLLSTRVGASAVGSTSSRRHSLGGGVPIRNHNGWRDGRIQFTGFFPIDGGVSCTGR